MGHVRLLVIGWTSIEEVAKATPKNVNEPFLGGPGASGFLRVKDTSCARRGIEFLEGNPHCPEILLENMRNVLRRFPDGYDLARSGDLVDHEEVVNEVQPAFAIVGGKWHQPELGMTLDAWLDQVYTWLVQAPPDALIAVYDVHL